MLLMSQLTWTFVELGSETDPMRYFACWSLASGEWPTSSNASVASWPARVHSVMWLPCTWYMYIHASTCIQTPNRLIRHVALHHHDRRYQICTLSIITHRHWCSDSSTFITLLHRGSLEGLCYFLQYYWSMTNQDTVVIDFCLKESCLRLPSFFLSLMRTHYKEVSTSWIGVF